jgi:D-proline reductase (dithiol) PrdB
MTSAGVHLHDDEPFNVETLEGDHSYRIIPSDTSEDNLTVTHIYYNTKYPKKDISIVFPLKQLRELELKNFIGKVSNFNIGINGGTLNHEPHETVTAPKIAKLLKHKEVDIVILIPG